MVLPLSQDRKAHHVITRVATPTRSIKEEEELRLVTPRLIPLSVQVRSIAAISTITALIKKPSRRAEIDNLVVSRASFFPPRAFHRRLSGLPREAFPDISRTLAKRSEPPSFPQDTSDITSDVARSLEFFLNERNFLLSPFFLLDIAQFRRR